MLARRANWATAAAALLLVGFYVLHRRRKAGRRWWPPGVEVRPSTIKGAGDGLFALRQFVTGEVLGDYSGERRNFLWMLQNENTGYVMCFGLNDYVDACVAFDCPGRYVNDTFDGRRNARFVRASGRAQVVAIKPIAAGEEVPARPKTPRAAIKNHVAGDNEMLEAHMMQPQTYSIIKMPDAASQADIRRRWLSSSDEVPAT